MSCLSFVGSNERINKDSKSLMNRHACDWLQFIAVIEREHPDTVPPKTHAIAWAIDAVRPDQWQIKYLTRYHEWMCWHAVQSTKTKFL